MMCRNCFYGIPDESKYCPHCGEQISFGSGDRPRARKKLVYTFLPIAVIALIFLGIWSFSPSSVPTQSVEITSPTPTPFVKLKQVYIGNSGIVVSPSYESVCPLSVTVNDDHSCYVYLEYMHSPSNSAELRTRKGHVVDTGEYKSNRPATSAKEFVDKYNNEEYLNGVAEYANSHASNYDDSNLISDISFFVTAGHTAEVDVPIGTYRLYYAFGDTWYGETHKFGDDTAYFSSNELLTFYFDGTYYQGRSLELIAQVGGNYDTFPIDESKFPG